MANQYKNKVVYNGTTLIDLSDTTAVQSDVASGKYFYVASGQRVQGTGQGGIVTQVILPQQTITATTADSSGYTVNINVSESLIDGANYIVTMDGTSYLCYANNKYGGTDIYMGDDNNIWGNLSQTQYPFCVATWGNGTTAWGVPDNQSHTVKIERVISFDEATLTTKTITTNGTYSASSDSVDGYSEIVVNVSGGSTGTWETKTDQGVTIIADNPNYFLWTYTEALGDDETFRITWGENGTQYICETSVDPSGSTADGYYLGNTSLVNIGDDTGEPFFIYKRTATEMACITNREAGSWHIKIEKQVSGSSGGITPTGTVSITTNGTHDVTNYASASVNVTPNLQSKSVTPTTLSQTISPDSGYDGLSSVTVGAIPSQYIVPTGNKAITENGNNIDVAQYSTVSVNVSGSSMNVQTQQSTTRRNNIALGSITSLTCSKAGTYDVYWSCARSSTSGTWGSQLYINGTAYGSENTTFSNHAQNNHLTGVTIPANATVAVYGRSRSGYYIYVPQLTIKQTA